VQRLSLLILLLALVVSGCAGGAAAPADHYYRLTAPASTAALAQPLLKAGLAVERLRTDTLLGGLPLVYSDAQEPLRVNSYRYFLWTEPPAQLVQRHLAGYLSQRGIAPLVYAGTARAATHYVLSGRLVRFEQQRRSSQRFAVVEANLVLRAPDSSTVLDQTFRRELEVGSESIHDTVAALGEALREIEQEFIEVLGRDR